MTALPTYDDVVSAHDLIREHIIRTPAMTSEALDEMAGAQLFFKCENLQHIGAFKYRGACNAVRRLSDADAKRGVVTFSSGNHAQAIARACAERGIPSVIVMPADSPLVKRRRAEKYGAEIIAYDRATQSREDIATAILDERGMTLLPPFDHPHIIAGQGTAAKELFEDIPDLDALYVCVGGGGLLSGCGLTARALSPSTRVVGVEPELGDDVVRSFETKKLQSSPHCESIADGARSVHLGELTFPLVLKNTDAMLAVSDAELAAAMFAMMDALKVVVEPTGALAFAGALKQKANLAGQRVGIIISGGNLDFTRIAAYRELL